MGRQNALLESNTYAPGEMGKRCSSLFPPPPTSANPASPPGFPRVGVEEFGVGALSGPGAVQPLVLKQEPRIHRGEALGTSSYRFLILEVGT